jgi:WhiB family redox-sensing transcriptional regulator
MVMMGTRAPKSRIELPCLADPDLFFAESPVNIAKAKEICRGCPAVEACLAGALARGEPWGVWGGELILRGEVIASKRGRGRPRGSVNRRSHPAVTGA